MTTMIFNCCGGGIDSEYCVIGYHIPINYMELYENYRKSQLIFR